MLSLIEEKRGYFMAKIDPSAVDKIIEYVGGRENITAVNLF
ncbi:hypothetical protein [Pasteurella canis]|nr:hypothetical protein [Pasteurella canis]